MKKVIAVTFGGQSAEHEVSVLTALQMIEHMDAQQYHAVPVFITKTGNWYTGAALFDVESYKNIPRLLTLVDEVVLYPQSNLFRLFYRNRTIKSPYSFSKSVATKSTPSSREPGIDIDVVFVCNHGTNGEDGTLQGLLELANIPYVGSNVIGSVMSMDKVQMKHLFRSVGLNTLDFHWFHVVEWIRNASFHIAQIESKFGYPVIVKPAIAGSSVGVAKVEDRASLKDAIHQASLYCPKILIEPYLTPMIEVNCSILGNPVDQTASVCERPVSTSQDILNYEDKYVRQDGGTKNADGGGMHRMDRVIPADISQDLTTTIQQMSKAAFRNLYCSGVARIDFMIHQPEIQEKDSKRFYTGGTLYINELNAVPGSLSFYLWEKSGIPFAKLIDRLIDLALENYRIKNNTHYTLDINLFQMQKGGGKKGGSNHLLPAKSIQVDGLDLSYTDYGQSDTVILFLHGWGVDRTVYNDLLGQLDPHRIRMIALDFPGFGGSTLPIEECWNTRTYANITQRFIETLSLNPVVIVGHSFGVRIAIRLANQIPDQISKMVFIDGAGIKPKPNWVRSLRVAGYKALKALYFFYQWGSRYHQALRQLSDRFGSADWKKASSPFLKKTLSQVVQEDLSPLLRSIPHPVHLIWGDHDMDTPLWMAEKMKKLIPYSSLSILQEAGHFSFKDQPEPFYKLFMEIISPTRGE